MNYGLYLSASGVLTNLYRQDVFSNNLANVETVGFKQDLPSIRQRAPESIEQQFGSDVSKRLLDKLGGGRLPDRPRSSNRLLAENLLLIAHGDTQPPRCANGGGTPNR